VERGSDTKEGVGHVILKNVQREYWTYNLSIPTKMLQEDAGACRDKERRWVQGIVWVSRNGQHFTIVHGHSLEEETYCDCVAEYFGLHEV
jgi:hypothetical protein